MRTRGRTIHTSRIPRRRDNEWGFDSIYSVRVNLLVRVLVARESYGKGIAGTRLERGVLLLLLHSFPSLSLSLGGVGKREFQYHTPNLFS